VEAKEVMATMQKISTAGNLVGAMRAKLLVIA
jgi:hypothetical protein